ncbi:MAG: hypothetical protein JWM44_2293 [Bacilli bacterium]|jgi:hypothetical protein|nr:hypothetical protein [Bacilli bacterium]
MIMIAIKSKEFNSIGYNEEEQAIYVKDKQDITRIFDNKSKEDFEQFKNSKQHDYFYLFVLRSLQHKTLITP